MRITRQVATTEPDRAAVPAAVPGEGDRVPGHLAADEFALTLADEQPGPLEPGEELVRRRGCGCGGADLASEPGPRRLGTTRRCAFSDSPLVGRFAAVRSRPAVRVRPSRCSIARQASPTL